MIESIELKKLSEIQSHYDCFFIDLWGVIHNGISLFADVKETLKKLKKNKKKVFFFNKCTKEIICDQKPTERIWIK